MKRIIAYTCLPLAAVWYVKTLSIAMTTGFVVSDLWHLPESLGAAVVWYALFVSFVFIADLMNGARNIAVSFLIIFVYAVSTWTFHVAGMSRLLGTTAAEFINLGIGWLLAFFGRHYFKIRVEDMHLGKGRLGSELFQGTCLGLCAYFLWLCLKTAGNKTGWLGLPAVAGIPSYLYGDFSAIAAVFNFEYISACLPFRTSRRRYPTNYLRREQA